MEENKSKFLELYHLDVSKYVERKQGLSYLSWSSAWSEFKKIYPQAIYEIVEDEKGNPWFGNEDVGYMCKTRVTADNLTYDMWLPIMDGSNKAMKLKPYKYITKQGEKVCLGLTMFDVNKTIMRCLVKNLAMFGLGLYIYAGEDLPEVSEEVLKEQQLAEQLLKDKRQELTKLVKEIIKKGVDKKLVMTTITNLGFNTNLAEVTSLEDMDKIFTEVNKLEVKEKIDK